ncbi:FAD-dependent oxidoreductase [Humibacter ginsengisoli]
MLNEAVASVAVLDDEPWRSAAVAHVADLADGIAEVTIDVPSWPGHRAGQYVDVRLPGASRWERPHSYSIANPPSRESSTRIALAVPAQAVADIPIGTGLHVDGPKGERMAWTPGDTDFRPLLLIGGGTGIVPLMAIAETWLLQRQRGPLQIIHSVRSLERRLYGSRLDVIGGQGDAEVATIITGDGTESGLRGRGGGRLSALDLELFGLPPSAEPECFVCGPASFVESVTRMLVQTKHPAARIRTEWEVSLEDQS